MLSMLLTAQAFGQFVRASWAGRAKESSATSIIRHQAGKPYKTVEATSEALVSIIAQCTFSVQNAPKHDKSFVLREA